MSWGMGIGCGRIMRGTKQMLSLLQLSSLARCLNSMATELSTRWGYSLAPVLARLGRMCNSSTVEFGVDPSVLSDEGDLTDSPQARVVIDVLVPTAG